MADVKISQLPAATTPVDGTEVLPIVQSATTKQVSIANLTAGRAMSASSLTLTTPLAVTSGGTGISTTGAGTFVVSATANTISATATPTLGVQQTTQGTLTLANTAAGAWPVTLQSSNIATAAWTMTLPTAPAAANGYILTSTTTGVTAWTNPTALGVDLDVGTTAITGGTTTRVLYNNAGVLGEYAVTGTGSVVLGTTPTFTTSALFPAGTVSAPGIAASGDTNTGIYFPAADTLAFATNGTEDGRFDSVGNLLLNSATLSPTQTAGGSIAMTGTLAMGSSFKRNRIINGDMRVDQRNAGAAVTTSGDFPVDRFLMSVDTDGAFSAQQNTDAPTGFVNSTKFTTTTADASLGASQYCALIQLIEGTNISDLAWGTAGAKTITLSFWVRSSLTGTFGGAVRNSAANRSYPFTYAISSANTFEYKTITIPGDTTGTWLTTNGIGIRLSFGLGVGSTFSGTAGSWSANSYISATGATSVIGTLNATWYITGVQLEVGSVATPYERQIYSDQLAQCQRYLPVYIPTVAGTAQGPIGQCYATTNSLVSFPFQVVARTPPTGVTVTNATNFSLTQSNSARVAVTGLTFHGASSYTGVCDIAVASGIVAGNATMLWTTTVPCQILFTGCEL